MNYPPAFLDNMRSLLGEEYPSFEAVLTQNSLSALRINPARPGVEALMGDTLKGAVAWEPQGRYVREGFHPGSDPLHFAGGYYMQDASAMAPARVLNAQPGELVLDLCAAPGGKSGQIAAGLNGSGCLVANEPDPRRAQALAGNLERLGAANTAVLNEYPEKLSRSFKDLFDAVLVDAPCSGEGMFRRDEAARGEWTMERAAGCALRQRSILAEAAKMVRPGGRLVYSTCTFNRAENEDNVRWLLEERPDFMAADFALPGIGQSQDGCLRLWPHKIKGEGHFVAMLYRSGTQFRESVPSGKPSKDAAEVFSELSRLIPGEWPGAFADWHMTLSKDMLWLAPARMPDLQGLRALTAGLRACQRGRGYVRPEHALAMAISVGSAERVCPLNDEETVRFLRGETLETDVSGWALATWKGLALGWGKGAQGMLKNHLPKGLRILQT